MVPIPVVTKNEEHMCMKDSFLLNNFMFILAVLRSRNYLFSAPAPQHCILVFLIVNKKIKFLKEKIKFVL